MDNSTKEINTLSLKENLKTTFSSMNRVIKQQEGSLYVEEIGTVSSVGKDIVTAKGLPEVKAGEIVIFKDRQRGMVFNLEPGKVDIILLDEPLGGLDAITRFKMQNWLLGVLEKLQVSILFITHDIEEAIFLSDRIYVLSNRPAKIKKEIVVDLPKPRNREIITSKKFNEIEKGILGIL